MGEGWFAQLAICVCIGLSQAPIQCENETTACTQVEAMGDIPLYVCIYY